MRSDVLLDRKLEANDVQPVGVRGYVTLSRLARAVDAPMAIEYWKSAPYFLNFVEAASWVSGCGLSCAAATVPS